MHLSLRGQHKKSLQPYILPFSCAFSATFKWCTIENAVQTAAHYMMLSVSVAVLTSVLLSNSHQTAQKYSLLRPHLHLLNTAEAESRQTQLNFCSYTVSKHSTYLSPHSEAETFSWRQKPLVRIFSKQQAGRVSCTKLFFTKNYYNCWVFFKLNCVSGAGSF